MTRIRRIGADFIFINLAFKGILKVVGGGFNHNFAPKVLWENGVAGFGLSVGKMAKGALRSVQPFTSRNT